MADLVAGGSAEPVTVTLDADVKPWERQLARAADSLARVSQAMESKFTKTADKIKEKSKESGKALEKFGGAFGGGLAGGIAGGVVAGGIVGVLTKIGETGGVALKEIALGLDRVNQKALESQRALSKFADSIERANKRSGEAIDSLVDPGAKIAELNKQISAAVMEQVKFDNLSRRIAEKMDEINGSFSSDGWQLWLGGKFGEASEDFKKNLEAVSAQAEAARKRFLDMKEARDKLMNPGKNPEFLKALNTFVSDLDTKIATINMTPLEQQLEGIRKQFNALPKDMEKALAKAHAFEALSKSLEMSKAFDEMAKSLDAERAAIGKTASEIKLMEAAAKGFGVFELGQIAAKLKEIDAAKLALEPLKRPDAMLAQSKEAASTILNAARAGANRPGGVMPGANNNPLQGKMVEILKDISISMNKQLILQVANNKDTRDAADRLREAEQPFIVD